MFLGLAGLNVLWFSPSPLLSVIMQDLNMDLRQGGLVISVVCLLIAVISLVGGWLTNKLGPKRVFTIGLWFMGIGASITYFVNSYEQLLGTRILIGIGIGLCLPVTGALVMMWFPENERPYMNTLNSLLPYVATTLTFTVTVPLYLAVNHSWRFTLALAGLFMVVMAALWSALGKEVKPWEPEEHKSGNQKSLLLSVLHNREVVFLSIAEAGDMWSFQFLTSYLPTYYITEMGLDIASASNITAVFPVAGIAAGLICGFWMIKLGRRKPFTWPLHLMIFLGTLLAINGTGLVRVIGVSLAGFGNAGWAPALFTMPMEFKDMNPAKVGAVYSVVFSSGFLAAFLSPWIGGWMAESISLHTTILIFSFSSLIAALATFLMKETGPGRKNNPMGSY